MDFFRRVEFFVEKFVSGQIRTKIKKITPKRNVWNKDIHSLEIKLNCVEEIITEKPRRIPCPSMKNFIFLAILRICPAL